MLKKGIVIFASGFVLLVLAFGIWAYTPLGPAQEGVSALADGSIRLYEEKDWWFFLPEDQLPKTIFIFYPGARVDPISYAPMGNSIARAGYGFILVRMPLNLAVFGVNLAENIIAAYPEVETWIIGGHSLGGAMAASFAYSHRNSIGGLILLASYPPESSNLSESGLRVLSIYASEDQLATVEKIEATKGLLPAQTVFILVEGGNHAQFGWYGNQPGDDVAKIDILTQQAIVNNEILKFLQMESNQ